MKSIGMGKRFDAGGDEEFKERVSKARARLHEMSEVEKASGWASPEDCDFDLHARTILTAFATGWRNGRWKNDFDVLFDAYAMLQDLERRLRTWDEIEKMKR